MVTITKVARQGLSESEFHRRIRNWCEERKVSVNGFYKPLYDWLRVLANEVESTAQVTGKRVLTEADMIEAMDRTLTRRKRGG